MSAKSRAAAAVERDRADRLAADNLRLAHANRLLTEEMVRTKSHLRDLEALVARQAVQIEDLQRAGRRRGLRRIA